MKKYGDEDFIFLVKEEAAEKGKERETEGTVHKNNIHDGFVILDGKRMEFAELPVSEGEFSMILPTTFQPMEKKLAKMKYSASKRPDFILTNPAGTVNLTFTHLSDRMGDEQTEEARDSIQAVVMRMHPESEVTEHGTIQVQERKLAYFGFETPAIDTDIYNLMFLFSLKGRMLSGAFNCLASDRKDWQEIFLQVLETVKFL